MSITDDPRYYVPTTDPASPGNLEYEPSQERDVAMMREAFVGPPLADPDTAEFPPNVQQQLLAQLFLDANRARRERYMRGLEGFETNSSGNQVAKVFDVPAGYLFKLTRLIVEVNGFTPASAATAGAWIAVLSAPVGTSNPSTQTVGQLRGMAGTNGAGLFLPAIVVECEKSAAPGFGTDQAVYVQVGGSQAALASKQCAVSWDGVLIEAE